MKGAVFLDRDGTVNEEVGYIQDLRKLKLIPGVAEVIRKLNQAKIPVILVTNQSGVARGYYSETWLIEKLHGTLLQYLEAENAYFDAVYYCPHLPNGTIHEYAIPCNCRKPEPGMLLQAQQKMDIDFSRSFMIGDKATDVEVGKRVNCQTILLTSGYGREVLAGHYQYVPDPDYIMNSLYDAYTNVMKDFYGLEN